MTAAEVNPFPLTATFKSPLPAPAVAGEMLLTTTCGGATVKVCAVDVPPPGVGSHAATAMVLAALRLLAGMVAFICVALTYVVVTCAPSRVTLVYPSKCVPVRVTVVSAAPA